MEIRYERVDALELVSGIYEDVRVSGTGHHLRIDGCDGFESPGRSGSDGDYPPAFGLCPADDVGGFLHLVFFDIVSLDRSECSETYMERELCDLDSLAAKLFEELFGEVKTCGRGSGRTGILAVDGLVTLGVIELLVYVRGERYRAGLARPRNRNG